MTRRPEDPPSGGLSAPTMDGDDKTTTRVPADTVPTDAMRSVEADLDGPSTVDTREMPLADEGFRARYLQRSLLGRGGMGEVRLCHDARIGRDIAMKVLRPGLGSIGGTGARFVREARVQGQLEHPAVVPVYDLGLAPDGEAFFTMKRVLGSTLEEVVDSLRSGNRDAERRFGRRRLLTAFSQVCLAVHFAHSRGVLHRDLKPGNIMLGDFGEVYVLDWGIARVASTDEPHDTAPDLARLRDTATHTAADEILGTPGYMAPEQIKHEELDERADVYALGCILFEMLTTHTLHERRSVPQILASTLHGADARASIRAPSRDVPPELEAICLKATALNREERHRDARAVHEDIEEFLDGDRDLERRRELADEHAAAARRAEERSYSANGKGSDRANAIFEVGRALALHPTHSEATQLLSRLMEDAPRRPPTEAVASVQLASRAAKRLAARASTFAYLAWLAFTPIVLWMGVREPRWALLIVALIAASAGTSVMALRSTHHGDAFGWVSLALGTLTLGLCGTLLGPLVIVPTLAVGHTTGYALRPGKRGRWIVVAAGCLAVVAPLAAELLGIVPASYAFRGGEIVIVPRLLDLPPVPTLVLMSVVALGTLVVTGIFVGRIRDELDEGENRLRMQTWYLGQLVPAEVRRAVTPAMPAGTRPNPPSGV